MFDYSEHDQQSQKFMSSLAGVEAEAEAVPEAETKTKAKTEKKNVKNVKPTCMMPIVWGVANDV